ncbi:MAG: glycogen debranching N-terminal domain-containing protein, partial [Bryobacteraceae bacterium]
MPGSPTCPTDVIEVGDHFYIRAQSSLADDRTRVLLHGDSFAVFDRHGDIHPVGFGQQGLFQQDTRYLSRLEFRVCGLRPLLLSSTVREDNILFGIDLTNPELDLPSGRTLPYGALHIYRTKFLLDGSCVEQILVQSYYDTPVDITLTIAFSADFSDIFEVRGQRRVNRGVMLPAEVGPAAVTLSYRGLDGVLRRAVLKTSFTPCTFTDSEILIPLHLAPREEVDFSLTISLESDGTATPSARYEESLARISSERASSPLAEIDIYTSNEQFNDWLNRSQSDLSMLTASTSFGPYPYAGIPW